MECHSLRALASIALLIPLAWVGIALVGKVHAGGGLTTLIAVWAIVMAAVIGAAVWSLVQARQARLERRPEGARRR